MSNYELHWTCEVRPVMPRGTYMSGGNPPRGVGRTATEAFEQLHQDLERRAAALALQKATARP